MRKAFWLGLIVLLGAAMFGLTAWGKEAPRDNEVAADRQPQQDDEAEEAAVRSLVEEFGSRLKTVSLLAPEDMVKEAMEENYGDLVAPGLLAEWASDPAIAPGRTVSSPWPDRIEIQGVEKLASGRYEVKGEIIEVTSTEVESGGAAARRPITLVVETSGEEWLIQSAELGPYDAAGTPVDASETGGLLYSNTDYGFSFTLPETWDGFTIVTDEWEGFAPESPQPDEPRETGPMVSLRHPEWTAEEPRQDIPILVLTVNQWETLQQKEFHIGAAPVGPQELARNSKYVFALPARYNYAFPTGFEEVEEILAGDPLATNEDFAEAE